MNCGAKTSSRAGLCMSKCVYVTALVEGQTEQIFVADILAPYLAVHGVYMTPIVLSKPGQKGGDVKFERAQRDIGHHLKQRNDTYITLLIDFYGTKEWPGLADAQKQSVPSKKADVFHRGTRTRVQELFEKQGAHKRFIPYISMHEFEALLFSNTGILANALRITESKIGAILAECGEPEAINDNTATAPSKRILDFDPYFKKTVDGINIAKNIGITAMRTQCPLFDKWLTTLEALPAL